MLGQAQLKVFLTGCGMLSVRGSRT